VPDLGACKAGTLTNFAAFIWESLPRHCATDDEHLEEADYDGAGAINFRHHRHRPAERPARDQLHSPRSSSPSATPTPAFFRVLVERP
jgi:hypothetical protein